MDYTNFFYNNFTSQLSAEKELLKNKTKATIEYLLDNKIEEKDILKVLQECSGKKFITKSDLPNFLWKNSLIKRDKFYYHHVLQIVSKTNDFYLEMKIQFTLKDLLEYFIKTLKVDRSIVNEKHYMTQIEILLKRYSKLNFVEDLDFVLTLIDNATWREIRVIEPFDLTSNGNAGETLDFLKSKISQAKANGVSREIFRYEKSI